MLDVAGVDVDAALDEEAHEVGALHGVDEARAPKVVRLLHVGASAHQTPERVVRIEIKRSVDLLSDPCSTYSIFYVLRRSDALFESEFEDISNP